MRNYEYEYENDWKLMKSNRRVNSRRQQTTNNFIMKNFKLKFDVLRTGYAQLFLKDWADWSEAKDSPALRIPCKL